MRRMLLSNSVRNRVRCPFPVVVSAALFSENAAFDWGDMFLPTISLRLPGIQRDCQSTSLWQPVSGSCCCPQACLQNHLLSRSSLSSSSSHISLTSLADLTTQHSNPPITSQHATIETMKLTDFCLLALAMAPAAIGEFLSGFSPAPCAAAIRDLTIITAWHDECTMAGLMSIECHSVPDPGDLGEFLFLPSCCCHQAFDKTHRPPRH